MIALRHVPGLKDALDVAHARALSASAALQCIMILAAARNAQTKALRISFHWWHVRHYCGAPQQWLSMHAHSLATTLLGAVTKHASIPPRELQNIS